MNHGGHGGHGGHEATTNMPDHGMHEGGHDMMMKMYFHFGYDMNILFQGWDATSTGKLIGTVIAVFLMGVSYEYVKFFRILLAQDFLKQSCSNHSAPESVDSLGEVVDPQTPSWFRRNIPHMTQSLLYFVQVTISFLLMLFAMTYNVWIFLAIVFGLATGYFFFASANKGFNANDCCN